MNILMINISASVMILLSLIIRKLLRQRISHNAFILLWLIIGVKLIIPISIDSSFSFLNLYIPIKNYVSDIIATDDFIIEAAIATNDLIIKQKIDTKLFLVIAWALGAICVFGYYLLQYWITRKKIMRCKPLNKGECHQWDATVYSCKLPFKIRFVQSEDIDMVALWGILKPVIILPSEFIHNDKVTCDFILLHECGHIKYFHSFFKMLSILILIIYWYNPFIWIFYTYLERDMEISSDYFVLKQMDSDNRGAYARVLLSATRPTKRSFYLYNYYNKSFITERIKAVMYFKKLSVGAAIVSVLVPTFVVSVFATTDIVISNEELEAMNVTVVSEHYGDEVPVAQDLTLNIEWEELDEFVSQDNTRANSYYVNKYKYSTYGVLPPNLIYIPVEHKGKLYSGYIILIGYVYHSDLDRYTGYYSGYIYL